MSRRAAAQLLELLGEGGRGAGRDDQVHAGAHALTVDELEALEAHQRLELALSAGHVLGGHAFGGQRVYRREAEGDHQPVGAGVGDGAHLHHDARARQRRTLAATEAHHAHARAGAGGQHHGLARPERRGVAQRHAGLCAGVQELHHAARGSLGGAVVRRSQQRGERQEGRSPADGHSWQRSTLRRRPVAHGRAGRW
jgi:hypothetical protein